MLRSGQTRLYNRVAWASTYLRKAGLLESLGPGRFQLSDDARVVLASPPEAIDVAFPERQFPEVQAFRKTRSRVQGADEEPPAAYNSATGLGRRVQVSRTGYARP